MQKLRVSVGVEEHGHVARARVAGADALGALGDELVPRLLDVGHAHREAADVAAELVPLVLRVPEAERRLPDGQLVGVVRIEVEPDHLAIPRTRPLRVPRRDVDEIDALDLHQGLVPSG